MTNGTFAFHAKPTPLALEELDLNSGHYPELATLEHFAEKFGLKAEPHTFVQHYRSSNDGHHQPQPMPYPMPSNIALNTDPGRASYAGNVGGTISPQYGSLDIGGYTVSGYNKLPETKQAAAQRQAQLERANLEQRPKRIFMGITGAIALTTALFYIDSRSFADLQTPLRSLMGVSTPTSQTILATLLLIVLIVGLFLLGAALLNRKTPGDLESEFSYRVRLTGYVPKSWRLMIDAANNQYPRSVFLIVDTVYNPDTNQFDRAGSSAQCYLALKYGNYSLGSFDFEPTDPNAPVSEAV